MGASLLFWSIQRDGTVDLVLRAMEDERRAGVAQDFAAHYQRVLSEYWASGIYESLRLLKGRNLISDLETAFFDAVFSDLDPIRMAIDKHEIAKDRAFDAPIEMVRMPARGDASDDHIYDPSDKQGKSHIAPVAVFPNGSLGWHVIDARNKSSRWVDRRGLSDRILKLNQIASPIS